MRALLVVCLQVTNTPWGERVSFVFSPAGDVSPKALHVSPFMDMDNIWWVHTAQHDSMLSALERRCEHPCTAAVLLQLN